MMNGSGLLATDFLDKPLALDKLDYPKMPSPSSDVISGMSSLPRPDRQTSPTGTQTSPSQSVARPQNHVSTVLLAGIPIVSLVIDGKERLCLAQISNTLLKDFSYNEIHNRRVALGITCVQCTPVQLEILRRAGAMPISSRRCGMITKREAERLVKSFLEESCPPQLPENFAFRVRHACGWGCQGNFMPARYNSSRAKCIKCSVCELFFSPNKFIFHFHRTASSKYHHPDAANFNSWRRHLFLDYDCPGEELEHAWEDVKAMFNGGSRKRLVSPTSRESPGTQREGEVKRARPDSGDPSSDLGKLPGLGLSYPYPVLPLASPACSNVAGYLARPPHPAFPFPSMDSGALGDNKGANNLADLWKAKAVNPYVNPFGLLWAKNFGLYSDPSTPYRQVMDLTQSGPMANRLCAGSRSMAEANKISNRDTGSLNKDEFWPLPKDTPSHTDNYFSAFKPVGRDPQVTFEPSSLRLSPERETDVERSWSERGSLLDDDRQWADRPHSLASGGSPVSEGEHSFPEPEVEAEAEDINVTDVDQSDAAKERETSKPTLTQHDVSRLLDTSSRDSDHQEAATDTTGDETLSGKDLCQQPSSECSGDDIFKNKGTYSLSKEELQSQLERLVEERSRAEKDYEHLKDSFQLKCVSDPSYKEEMEREFAIVKDAHDALRQFSNKMVALRNCLDLIKPVQ